MEETGAFQGYPSPFNVKGARAFGLRAVRFQSYAQARAEVEALLAEEA